MKKNSLLFILTLIGFIPIQATIYRGTYGINAFTWSLDTENKVLTISGQGIVDYSPIRDGAPSWKTCGYEGDIIEIKVEEGVTNIGYLGEPIITPSVQSLTLPSTYDYEYLINHLNNSDRKPSIHVSENAPNHKSVDGVVFSKDGKVLCLFPSSKEGKYSIPETVDSICPMAFSYSNITAIHVPQSLNKDIEAFRGNSKLKEITVEKGHTTYTSIDGVLFNNKVSQLLLYPPKKEGETYSIPESVKNIGINAFVCSILKSIKIPESVATIGNGAFYGCTLLEEIHLPSHLTNIGNDAFSCCYSLTHIEIPRNTTFLPSSVFSSCYNLTDITISEFHPSYRSINGLVYDKDKTTLHYVPLGKKARKFIIPDFTTAIGEYVFDQHQFDTISIPASISHIDTYAFCNLSYHSVPDHTVTLSVHWISPKDFPTNISFVDNIYNPFRFSVPFGTVHAYETEFLRCTITECHESTYTTSENENIKLRLDTICGLAEISGFESETKPSGQYDIPSTIQPDHTSGQKYTIVSIGESSFYECKDLTSVNIPATIRNVGANAFANCDHITDVYSQATTPPNVAGASRKNRPFSQPGKITLHVPTGTKAEYEDIWLNFKEYVEDIGSGIPTTSTEGENEPHITENGIMTGNTPWQIFTTDGRVVACGTKSKNVKLPKGLYIVRSQGHTQKLYVK